MIRRALATARLTRLITEDTITEDLREQLSAMHPMADELLHCWWCAGIWAAGAIMVTDRTAPVVVDMLATAQAGTMLMSLAERINR